MKSAGSTGSKRSERTTQNRVVELLTGPVQAGGLGYRHLGDRSKHADNRPIDTSLLRASLAARGYSPAHIAAALQKLEVAADSTGITLYQANLRTYQLLRYGAQVQLAAGQPHETVELIDWATSGPRPRALAQH